jgi:hypothetical protein
MTRSEADADQAAASPQRLSDDPLLARRGLPMEEVRPRPGGARRDGEPAWSAPAAGRQLRTWAG